jgi:hypothetical protein
MRIQKIIVYVMFAACFSPGARVFADQSTTVKQYEFTWTFDKPVQTGQFVNGDWWVVPAPGQDSVTVVSVDPAPKTGPDGKLMNGSMVNPMPGFQAFDQRAGIWKAKCGATYPLKLQVNQSLASAVSETDADDAGKKRLAGQNYVKDVAVLTCLSKPPLSTDFRPSYVGNDKTLYDSAKMRRDLLPNLPLPASVKEVPNLKDLADAFYSRPWVDFLRVWAAFQSKGRHEIGYGREKTVEVGVAGLLLCLDTNVVGDKEPLLIDFVQTGIDLYGTVSSGGRWISDGGWQMGRKFPILFAGLMLDDKGMLGIGQKYPPTTNTFQEDTTAFIVTKADIGRQLSCMVNGPVKAATANTIGLKGGAGFPAGKMAGNRIKIVDGPGAGQVRYITKDDLKWAARNGQKEIITCEVDPPWDTVPEVDKSVYQVLGYQEEDIGHGKYGGNHWRDEEGAKGDNPSFAMPYSAMNKGSWPGEVLAARILGLKAAWNQDAVFQVVDDYIVDTAPGSPLLKYLGGCPRFYGSKIDENFISAMWETYRSKYGDPSLGDANK